jgi:hypothetical protein
MKSASRVRQPDDLAVPAVKVARETSNSFRTRVSNFVRAAYPEAASPQRGGDWQTDPRPTRSEAAKCQGYIRNLRAGNIAQPPLDKAWSVGLNLSVLSGHRWLNQVVMQFVCGYYGHVAQVMLDVPESIVPAQHRAMMVAHLPALAALPPPPTIEEDRNQLVFEGLALDIAHQTAQWAAQMRRQLTPEMAAWQISNKCFGAFLESWRRISAEGLNMQNPAVATCQFITEQATFPVEERDRICVALIRDALLNPVELRTGRADVA